MTLEEIIQAGETQNIEFKSSFDHEVIESLVAFANSLGGSVWIGINDNKEIKGITIGKETVANWLNEIKQKTSPQLIPEAETISHNGKTIIKLTITEYPVKPVSTKGRCYKRVANSNHLLSVVEVADIHLKTINTSWDFYIRQDKGIEDLSMTKVEKAIQQISQRSPGIENEDQITFLKKYELLRPQGITNACYLMFCENDQWMTTIEMGHFSSSTVIKDALTLKSDIIHQVEDAMAFIRKHINKEIIITAAPQNEQRWQYPLQGLRELVMNMIVHRDYTSSYDSQIKIYPDSIEFYNPGCLPADITVAQLLTDDYVSLPRNRQIAQLFKELGWIEKYGSGIKRVRQLFTLAGLAEPEFKNMESGFYVKVKAPPITPPIPPPITPPIVTSMSLNDKILLLLKDNPNLSRTDIATRLSISPNTAKEYLAKLSSEGKIVRKGSNRAGYWEVRS